MILKKPSIEIIKLDNNHLRLVIKSDIGTINTLQFLNNKILESSEIVQGNDKETLVFIIPDYLNIPEGEVNLRSNVSGNSSKTRYYINGNLITNSDDRNSKVYQFLRELELVEQDYIVSTRKGKTISKNLVPLSTSKTLILEGNESNWNKYIFRLINFNKKTVLFNRINNIINIVYGKRGIIL